MSNQVDSNKEQGKIDKHVWLMSAVFISGAIMSILDVTIVNVALDTLGRDFHSSLTSIQWVITGYMLALATVIPLTGWGVERFGAKRLWLASLTLFIVGSALSGMAWSVGSLIFFRVIQGFGGGMIMPVGMTMLTRAAGPHRIGRVMGFVGVPMLLGPVIGPVLGGLLVQEVSWRWIFYVNVPIGILALLFSYRVLPSERTDRSHALDWRGFLLLSPGLASFVYGLAQIAAAGDFSSKRNLFALIIGVVLVAAFIVHALRVKDRTPLLDLRLFKNLRFSVSALTVAFLGASLFGAMILYPLYYQVVRGEDALTAGLLLAPQGLGAAVVMPVAGMCSDRFGVGRVVLVGLILSVLPSLAFTDLSADTGYFWLSAVLFARGIGLGLTMMPAMSAAYQTLSHEAIPRATSTLNIIQRVGGSIGTAIFAVILERSIANRVPGSSVSSAAEIKVVPPRIADALASAFSHTFWAVVIVTVFSIPPALLLLRRERNQELPTQAAEGLVEF